MRKEQEPATTTHSCHFTKFPVVRKPQFPDQGKRGHEEFFILPSHLRQPSSFPRRAA